jgi:putative inorganic carbon (HCO3(-)) transporter
MNRLLRQLKQPLTVFYLASALTVVVNVFLILIHFFWLAWTIPVLMLVAIFFVFSFDYLLYFVVFITPLGINLEALLPNHSISFPTEPLLAGLLLVFIVKLFMGQIPDRKVFQHPIVIIVVIYLFWILITAVTSQIPVVSFKYFIAQLWFVVPLLFMATPLFKDLRKVYLFYWLYIISFCIVIINTTYNHAGYGFSEKGANLAMSPFYNDHTAYAVMLAFFIPVLAGLVLSKIHSNKLRAISLVVLSVFVIAIILSYCRAAWISLGVSLIVLIVIVLKIKLRWLALSFLLVVGAYYMYQQEIADSLKKNKQESSTNYTTHVKSMLNVSSDASNLERINRWHCAIRLFEVHPNLGWGPGTYQFVYGPYQLANEKTIISTNQGDRGNAHSEYLGPLSESGWPGLLCVLILFSLIIYKGIRIYQRAVNPKVRFLSLVTILGFISYFAHGIMNNFLTTDKASVPFWGFVAIIVALDLYHKE